MLDGPPSDVHPAKIVNDSMASVDDSRSPGSASIWVDVRPDGGIESGGGVPEWWPADGGTC